MEERLPADWLAWLDEATGAAADQGAPLYLVGGSVRDLLLGRPTRDFDLVVEGDADKLADAIAERTSAEVMSRSQFGTVKLLMRWETLPGFAILDVATARSESYARPGALPEVARGTMEDDLARRDFSINAIAYPLHWGRDAGLLDPHYGLDDLMDGLVRTLHDGSFVDDATRIMRAVRYEQRLGFALEERTESLLRRDLPMLDTISPDRLGREFFLWFGEERFLAILARADSLGVLAAIHPALAGAGVAALEATAGVDERTYGPGVVLGLLVRSLSLSDGNAVIQRLRLRRGWASLVRAAIALRERLPEVAAAAGSASRLYDCLSPLDGSAVKAWSMAAPDARVREALAWYDDRLRYLKPVLKGKDLLALGVPQGPAVGAMMARLRYARLEGETNGSAEEAALVRRWLAEEGGRVGGGDAAIRSP